MPSQMKLAHLKSWYIQSRHCLPGVALADCHRTALQASQKVYHCHLQQGRPHKPESFGHVTWSLASNICSKPFHQCASQLCRLKNFPSLSQELIRCCSHGPTIMTMSFADAGLLKSKANDCCGCACHCRAGTLITTASALADQLASKTSTCQPFCQSIGPLWTSIRQT